MDQMLEDL
jgi:hypothetical protein